MHSVLLLVFVLFNAALLHAIPSAMFYSDEDLRGDNYIDPVQLEHLAKRMAIPTWLHKRNPGLCDYRLQLRPLPMTSALCAYGESVCSSAVLVIALLLQVKAKKMVVPPSTVQIRLDVFSYGCLLDSMPSDGFL